MKKKIILGLSLVSLMTLASCNWDRATDKDLINAGYDVVVTFDANGGKIGNYDYRKIYCMKDSYIICPGYKNGNDSLAEAVKQDVNFGGWYYGEKDENGNVTLTEPFAFEVTTGVSVNKVTESITLYAKWTNSYTYTVLYGDYDETTGTYSRSKVYETASADTPYGTPNLSLPGYTLFGYYKDKEFTEAFDWTVAATFDESQNVNVYAKFLKGTYIFVSNAEELKKATIKSNTCIYLQGDIDMTGIEGFKFPDNYTGTIMGNGYSIKNLTVVQTQSGTSDTTFGLFKSLTNATIQDLTIDNLTLNVNADIGANIKAGLFAGSLENTKIKNVKIKNSKLNIITSKAETEFKTAVIYVTMDSSSKVTDTTEENNTISFN